MASVEKVSVAVNQREWAVEELGRLWDIGMESGPAGDGEEVFARLRTCLDAKLSGVD